MADGERPGGTDDRFTRYAVALMMIIVSMLAIVVLCATIVIASSDRAGASEKVLNTLLPLLGTWVGTVLAYYFSKENLAAATSSVTTLARQISGDDRLRTISVKDRMLPRSRIATLPRPPEDATKLVDIAAFMTARNVRRLPVVDANDVVELIVHRSEIDRFIAAGALTGAKPVAALTWKDLLDVPELRTMFGSFATVAETATMTDAKAQMEKTPNCEDVFVTDNGKKDGKLLGWVTDNDIIAAARV